MEKALIGDQFPDWVGDKVEGEVDKGYVSVDEAWRLAAAEHADIRRTDEPQVTSQA